MAVIYGSLHVDEKYSGILEPNLYHGAIFADGITFTSKYEEGPAGGIFVHKLTSTPAVPGTPGRDFTDEATADTLIPIVLNNNFQKSKKIYGVQAAAVSAPLADESLSMATQEVGEGWNVAGCACLATEGTDMGDTAALTTANVKTKVLAARKMVADGKGKANVLICNTDTYAKILEAAGASFTPSLNDAWNMTGNIGTWLGFVVVEASALNETTAKYYDHAGDLKEVDLSKVDFMLYNSEAFSIVNNFDVARIIDSENFAGSKAQVELNAGYRVTSAPQVVVKKHA